MRKTDHSLFPEGGSGRYLFLHAAQSLTSSAFDSLAQADQEALIAAEGIYIAVRQEPEFIIRLYQLGTFYAELFYHRVSQHPVCIRSFTGTARLDPYVNGLDLGFAGDFS